MSKRRAPSRKHMFFVFEANFYRQRVILSGRLVGDLLHQLRLFFRIIPLFRKNLLKRLDAVSGGLKGASKKTKDRRP